MFPQISGWRDWGRVYQDAPLYLPLIQKIYASHGLALSEIERLTPGTNAVFAIGGTVIKLFAPKESSVDPVPTYFAELNAMNAAARAGLPVPAVLASGVARDRYDFYYIVMRRALARDAKALLPGMDAREREAFAGWIRAFADALHGLPVLPDTGDVYTRAKDNLRLRGSGLPLSFLDAVPGAVDEIKKVYGGQEVFTHGDLTGDNVLIGENGQIHIIDFADARMAPALYELAPLYFDLFDCDIEMLKTYMPGHRAWDLVEPLVNSLCLHEFGLGILADFLCKRLDIPVSRMDSLNALRGAVAAAGRGGAS